MIEFVKPHPEAEIVQYDFRMSIASEGVLEPLQLEIVLGIALLDSSFESHARCVGEVRVECRVVGIDQGTERVLPRMNAENLFDRTIPPERGRGGKIDLEGWGDGEGGNERGYRC